MEFRLLGPLEAVDGRGVVPMGRPRARALLALLLLRAGRTVPAGVLVADMWGDRPPGNPTATLHSHVAALRRYLGPAGPVLRTVPGGYSLEVSPEVIDATRFEALAGRAAAAVAAHRLEEADRLYREARALWRGAALADLRDVAALDAAAVRLDEARLQAVEQHIDVRLRRGDTDLVPELQALVAAEPLREALACQLMVAPYRGGRQADALAVYDRLRTWLDDELGLRPGAAADRVQAAILRHDPALDPPAVFGGGAVGFGVERVVVGLTAVQDRMFGRDGDVLAVEVALAGARLVTLTGPGGVGKTRLSVAVAERWADRWGGLVAFVPLAGTVQNDDALAATARALDVEPDPDQPVLDAMAEQLADRSALMVLDNLEQIPQVGAVVSGLLERCPGVRVLATSRGPLRTPGERRHPLGPLAVPAEEASPDTVATADAVALFVDRADGVDAGDLADVAALCRLLEGLPLAIELVAARTTVLPPAVLLERLAAEGHVGPDLGEEGLVARPARHRTLRATVAWSHDLLGSAGRRLFAMLGVFSGGASLEAVEALWAGVAQQGVDEQGSIGSLEVLSGLVDSGLVRRAPQNGRARVQLPEPVRAFALAQLQASGSGAAVRAAHAAHFLAVVQAGKPAPGFTDTRRLAELDADADNLRAALRWLLSHDELVAAARLATGLYRWWFSTGRFTEGRRWVEVLLERAALPPDLRAELLLADGFLAANQAVFDVALARYRDSAELWAGLDVPAGRARAAFGEAAVHLGRNRAPPGPAEV